MCENILLHNCANINLCPLAARENCLSTLKHAVGTQSRLRKDVSTVLFRDRVALAQNEGTKSVVFLRTTLTSLRLFIAATGVHCSRDQSLIHDRSDLAKQKQKQERE